MDRYYTLMLIPEKNQQIKSIKIPTLAIKMFSVFAFAILLFLAIILIDYWGLMQNVVDNKHVSMENKQLREQLQIFQMKINSLTNDVERISIFEQKLRTITGLEREKLTKSYFETLQVIQEQNQNILDDSTHSNADSSNAKNSEPLNPTPILDNDEDTNASSPSNLIEKIRGPRAKTPTLKVGPDNSAPESAPVAPPSAPPIAPATSKPKHASMWHFRNWNPWTFFSNAYAQNESVSPFDFNQFFKDRVHLETKDKDPHFKQLLDNHQEQFLKLYQVSGNYKITQSISNMVQETYQLAYQLATFDYQFENVSHFDQDLEQRLHELDEFLLDRDSMLKSTPILMPVNGWITSFFGPRINPYTGRLKMHEGIDIGAPHGATIKAPADGVVVFSGIKPGFGKHVQLDHGYGIETLYAHSERLYVKTGQRVQRGTVLANVGSTGHSTGPHLHYEVRINSVPVDPFYFILE